MKIKPILPDVGSCVVHIHQHGTNATKESSFSSDKSAIIEDIKQKAFGAEAWKRFFGVRTKKFELNDKILKFLLAPDAFDPTQLNYMTHFLPILIPQTIQEVIPQATPPVHRHRFTKYIDSKQYNFEVLNKLVQKPLLGHPSQIDHLSVIIAEIEKLKAEPPCWLVARKELLAKDLSTSEQIEYIKKVNEKTQAGYEELPSALDLSTVALVHRVVTGERYLADRESGSRSFSSLSRCKETVEVRLKNQHVVLGSHTCPVVDSREPKGGLLVAYIPSDIKADNVGIAAVRRFPVHSNSGL